MNAIPGKDQAMTRALLALALLVALAGAAVAQTAPAQTTPPRTIVIGHPWARASTGKTGVTYLTIVNKGTADDRLISASTPVAQKAEPHTTVNDNGIMKMRPVDGIAVKAGGEAVLKPGGLHLMLIGLNGPLKAGQSFPLTLTFEKAGKIEATVAVEKAGAMSGQSMPGMSHSMPGMDMN
jgi:periplasmic copper chaperone A